MSNIRNAAQYVLLALPKSVYGAAQNLSDPQREIRIV